MIMGSSKDLLDWEGRPLSAQASGSMKRACPTQQGPHCCIGRQGRRVRLPDQYVASWTCGMPSSTQRV